MKLSWLERIHTAIFWRPLCWLVDYIHQRPWIGGEWESPITAVTSRKGILKWLDLAFVTTILTIALLILIAIAVILLVIRTVRSLLYRFCTTENLFLLLGFVVVGFCAYMVVRIIVSL